MTTTFYDSYNSQNDWDNSRPADEIYPYHLADGSYAYEVQRQGRGKDKAFRVGRTNMIRFGDRGPDDRWQWKAGSGRHGAMLYRLPELLEDMAARPDDPVYICEGERDVDALRKHGLIATTNSFGAKSWRNDFASYLKGRRVVICEDNDKYGQQRTERIRRSLWRVAA